MNRQQSATGPVILYPAAADRIETSLRRAAAILDLIERISEGQDLVELSIGTLSNAASLAKNLVLEAKGAADDLWSQARSLAGCEPVEEVPHG